MSDLSRIHALIARTRRRLRAQKFLEWLVTGLPLAVAGGLAVMWFWRMEQLADGAALGLALGLLGVLIAVALAGAMRPMPRAGVANRLDRASGLADRLGTACEFVDRLQAAPDKEHPDTRALMEAAIADAQAHADRANPRVAAPFKTPRDTRAAAAFLVIAGAVASLGFSPDTHRLADFWPKPVDDAQAAAAAALRDKQALDSDDINYARQYVEELRAIAEQSKDPALLDLSKQLSELLDKAERGDISKEDLLARMDELEKNYDAATRSDPTSDLSELKDAAKELKKEPLTRRLGEALEAGDMDAAAKEMERLADQIDKKELTPEQQQRLAAALDKASKKQDEARAKQEQQRQQENEKKDDELAKKKDEVRRLEKKSQEHPEDQQAKRQLEKKKRELDKLERDKQDRDQQAKQDKGERKLDRLGRDMKQGAENLKNKKSEQASENLKDGAKQAKGFENEQKQAANKKQSQSQLNDLKQALRNAKQRKGGQNGRQLSRLGRRQEWEQRAGGQQPGGQKPGDKPGQGPDGKGPPGPGHGDTPSPGDVMGDPTHPKGPTRTENLAGVDGRGPSKRQTIVTAAQKGFSSTAYKQVYADYKKVVEEVIRQEKIPPSYRYLVKRYIDDIIRPRQD
jgi:hypothetical protein